MFRRPRASDLPRQGGLVAMIIGDTWMTIKTFEKFQEEHPPRHARSHTFLHLQDVSNHSDIFGANAAFVLAGTSRRLSTD